MKNSFLLIFVLLIICSVNAQNAVKKVIVEPYYISDANDATDTTGSYLEPGSKTFRIYIQLKPGCRLSKIYGDERHTLKIASTASFFNNIDYGKSFGKDFNKVNYKKNTVALDTWLTIGQTTKKSSITYFGIPKSQDTDGSFIGGLNNDGGSSEISGGLLANNDPFAGVPLTLADGMDTLVNIPDQWSDNGFFDIVSGIDTTIFGSARKGSAFESNNAFLQNSGVTGVNPDSNQVLVAQLTTTGDISFQLNIEVKESNGSVWKYVAQGNDTLDERVCPFLKYPPECGCTDKNYLEYSSAFLCANPGSCKTPIVFGCMDPASCNYNPDANYNVQSLCCYPGLCADRDISLVCPELKDKQPGLKIYPNPSSDKLEINVSNVASENFSISITNMFGVLIFAKNIRTDSDNYFHEVNISSLMSGIYYLHVRSLNGIDFTKILIKK
jgi:hypothetical protein